MKTGFPPHIPSGKPHLSSPLQFPENQNVLMVDLDYLRRKSTAFSYPLFISKSSILGFKE